MAEHKMLTKAFTHAMTNPALRWADFDVDFIIIKNDMEDYLEKKGESFSVEEIESYIKAKFAQINEGLKDFSYSNKIMD